MDTLKVTDIRDMLIKTKELYGDRPVYRLRGEKPGEFREITHKEARDMVDCLGTALVSMLNLKGKRIAIIGENRYEWEISYLSVVAGTGTVVPLDKALPENELDSLIRRSEVEAIFYSERYEPILKKLAQDGTTKLKHLICFDAKENKDGVYAFNELIQKGKRLIDDGDIAFTDAEIDPEAMTIMLFTSGTTSASKAVALCQRNICANLMDMGKVLYMINEEDVMLSFLPVHHVFECTVGFLLSFYKGLCTAFCDGPRHILENINEYGVTFMVCVPAIYELLYKTLMKNLEKAGKLDAIKQLMEAHKNDTLEEKAKIFKDIHNIFGGKIKLLISGAAALDPEVETGYRNLGINLLQGYGLTESSPVICVNLFPEKDELKHKVGSIGKALPSFEVKIDDPNDEGVGELLARGPSVMLGYYGNEEATKETLEPDGWLHTGDLCRIDDEGFIYISGRKKSVIVLKNGKNIFPEEMENLVNKIEGVNESMIYSVLNNDAIDENDIKIAVEAVYDKEIMKEMYGAETEKEIYDIIWNKIKEINKTMPLYKAIRGLVITQEPIAKTTTGKIKRYEELKKIQSK